MPNHVHVLFRSLQSQELNKIIRSWKGVSARKLNVYLQSSGKVWQEDYWDRLIRSQKHLSKTISYIKENPQKAHLGSEQYLYYLAKDYEYLV